MKEFENFENMEKREDGFVDRIIKEFGIEPDENPELVEEIRKCKETIESSPVYQALDDDDECYKAFKDIIERDVLQRRI